MKTIARSVVLGISLLAVPCLGGTPDTEPAAPNGLFGVGAAGTVFKSLDVPAGMSVTDLLRRVQEQAPEFQYVAEPGDWQQHALPKMTLHGVTVQQVLDILTTVVPGVKVVDVGNGPNGVYVFHDTTGPAYGANALGAYGLTDPVERLGLRDAYAGLPKGQGTPTPEQIAAGRKKALQEVLSLVESAATQADPSVRPSLKLHEETDVLLVSGTPFQLDAVSHSLTALQSAELSKQYKISYENLMQENRAANNNVASLRVYVENLKANDAALTRRISDLERENAALKEQLHFGPGDKH